MNARVKWLVLVGVSATVFLLVGGYDVARLEYHKYIDAQYVDWRHSVVANREDVMATKTQVTDGGAYITGTLRVQNQTVHPILLSAPTANLAIQAGNITLALRDISTTGWDGPDPQPVVEGEPGPVLTFVAEIFTDVVTPGNAQVAHQFIYINGAGDDDIEWDFSISITGRRIWRTESTASGSGRDNSPVYAKEVTETDAWEDIEPISWDVTLGSLRWAASSLDFSDHSVSAVDDITLNINQHKGNAGVIYAEIKDLKWDDGDVNLSRYEYPSPKPASGVYLNGKVGGFDVEIVTNSSLTRDVTHGIPLIADFSVFGVWDRDGALVSGARVSGGFVANNHIPDSLNWSTENGAAALGDTVYPTVAELRAVGTWVQTAGLVTGLSYRDPDDSYDLLSGAARSFSITALSAREQLIDDADLNINLRVPPINKSTCYADTDWLGAYIMRRDGVGIYGPADALAHDDWIGSGGVPTADVAGAFEVTADGSLTLTIPSGYQTRLDEVPLGTAPAGPPTIYMYHKSDAWSGEPSEGAYDWRGFEQLNIPITAPDADTLSLLITYRTYTHSDNHLSDSTRSTTYTYTATEQTQTFSLAVVAGAQTVEVPLIAVDPYPIYERVVSIALSGFDAGAWVIGEPTLVIADPTQSILKTFEGPEYHHGGASAHADAAYVWYDADENNGGRANHAEKTVRNFDYSVGAGSGLDLTTAYTLEQFANNIEKVSEVFECHRNDAAYGDAMTDDEEPPNTLSACWAFNVCYPDAHAPDGNPLEQDVT